MTSGLAEDTRKGLLPSHHTFVQPQLHETMCVFMFDCVHHMGMKMSLTLLLILHSYMPLHPTFLSLPPNFWCAPLLVRVGSPYLFHSAPLGISLGNCIAECWRSTCRTHMFLHSDSHSSLKSTRWGRGKQGPWEEARGEQAQGRAAS